ncbi:MAG: hypothetical protein V1673_02670 [Candidatus Omnitrophota bacterium]
MRIKYRSASIDRCWDRVLRSFFGAFFFVSLLSCASVSLAEAPPNTELEGILRKIESRHYRWIAIRADVFLFFAKGGDPNAMCGGELLYQRLDERMFLTCVDARQELIFIFRTFDRRFDLYLPAQNTVYHGSIFDLEDSPDIESHLKARDLYRALKPMAVDPRRAKIERTNFAITSLDVYGRNEKEGALVRKLYLTPESDVRGELFYNAEGRPVTEIQRYDFREIQGHAGSYDSVIFPKKITILSPETKKGSAIFFTQVTALDTVDPLEFILRVPPGTKEVFLDERDPRYQRSKTTAAAPGPAPVSSAKTVPVYLAKPREIPKTKITPPPAQKEKKTPEAPKPAAAPTLPVSVNVPENTDADMAPEGPSPAESSSASDAQTTLDPSVGPSLEMGKS